MQLLPLLFFVVVCAMSSVTFADEVSKATSPRDNKNKQVKERPKYLQPGERRRLSLFPKMKRKPVITTESFKDVTYKPFKYAPKRRLMPKLAIMSKEKYKKERHSEENNDNNRHPFMKMKSRVHSDLNKKETQINSKESEELITKKTTEVDVKVKNKFVDQDNPMLEEETKQITTSYIKHKDINLKSKTGEVKPQERKNSEESEEVADKNEFIFLNPNTISEPKEVVSSETIEEYVTTEENLDHLVSRVKRNVIEEENTVTIKARQTYHERDTKQSSSLIFNNINS